MIMEIKDSRGFTYRLSGAGNEVLVECYTAGGEHSWSATQPAGEAESMVRSIFRTGRRASPAPRRKVAMPISGAGRRLMPAFRDAPVRER